MALAFRPAFLLVSSVTYCLSRPRSLCSLKPPLSLRSSTAERPPFAVEKRDARGRSASPRDSAVLAVRGHPRPRQSGLNLRERKLRSTRDRRLIGQDCCVCGGGGVTGWTNIHRRDIVSSISSSTLSFWSCCGCWCCCGQVCSAGVTEDFSLADVSDG